MLLWRRCSHRLLSLAAWVNRGRGGTGLFDAIELAAAERWVAVETARELGYSDDLWHRTDRASAARVCNATLDARLSRGCVEG